MPMVVVDLQAWLRNQWKHRASITRQHRPQTLAMLSNSSTMHIISSRISSSKCQSRSRIPLKAHKLLLQRQAIRCSNSLLLNSNLGNNNSLWLSSSSWRTRRRALEVRPTCHLSLSKWLSDKTSKAGWSCNSLTSPLIFHKCSRAHSCNTRNWRRSLQIIDWLY